MNTRNYAKLKKLLLENNESIRDTQVRMKLIEESVAKAESDSFKSNLTKTTEVIKALSSEHRILILLSIFNTIMFTQELEYILDLSQSVLNHHIRKLASSDLIYSKRSGKVNVLTTSSLGKKITEFLLEVTRETNWTKNIRR